MSSDPILAALEASWPPAATEHRGPLTLRRGAGGGQRVSATTVAPGWTPADLDAAEDWMRAEGQSMLFRVLPGDSALDAALAARGYVINDPVVTFTAPVERLMRELPRLRCFAIWPPLEVQREIWAADGLGPARVAVMERAADPKTAILGRDDDRPAGAAYVGALGQVAALHALHVLPAHRRRGLARDILSESARWAASVGCTHLTLLVTAGNFGAQAAYHAAGMEQSPGYHYRLKPAEGA